MFKLDRMKGMMERDALHTEQCREAVREARAILAASKAEAIIPPQWQVSERQDEAQLSLVRSDGEH